jgi:hypothetical protein
LHVLSQEQCGKSFVPLEVTVTVLGSRMPKPLVCTPVHLPRPEAGAGYEGVLAWQYVHGHRL